MPRPITQHLRTAFEGRHGSAEIIISQLLASEGNRRQVALTVGLAALLTLGIQRAIDGGAGRIRFLTGKFTLRLSRFGGEAGRAVDLHRVRQAAHGNRRQGCRGHQRQAMATVHHHHHFAERDRTRRHRTAIEPRFQIAAHVRCALIALAGIARQRTQSNRLKITRHRPIGGRHLRWSFDGGRAHLEQHIMHIATDHRRTQRQQFEEDRSQRIDITASIQLGIVTFGLFRRHVGRRAQDAAFQGHVVRPAVVLVAR